MASAAADTESIDIMTLSDDEDEVDTAADHEREVVLRPSERKRADELRSLSRKVKALMRFTGNSQRLQEAQHNFLEPEEPEEDNKNYGRESSRRMFDVALQAAFGLETFGPSAWWYFNLHEEAFIKILFYIVTSGRVNLTTEQCDQIFKKQKNAQNGKWTIDEQALAAAGVLSNEVSQMFAGKPRVDTASGFPRGLPLGIPTPAESFPGGIRAGKFSSCRAMLDLASQEHDSRGNIVRPGENMDYKRIEHALAYNNAAAPQTVPPPPAEELPRATSAAVDVAAKPGPAAAPNQVAAGQTVTATKPREGGMFFGVTAKGNKWRAQIKIDKKDHNLGYFATAEEAARAYDAEVRRRGLEKTRNINFPATAAENNVPKAASGYFGVTASKNKWRAQIQIDKVKHHIGNFATAEEAARAFDAEIRRRGLEKTRNINFPATADEQNAQTRDSKASTAKPQMQSTRVLRPRATAATQDPEVAAEQTYAPASKSESGYFGVTRGSSAWVANIRYNGKSHYIGSFSTARAAAVAFDAEARRVWLANKRKLNFPKTEAPRVEDGASSPSIKKRDRPTGSKGKGGKSKSLNMIAAAAVPEGHGGAHALDDHEVAKMRAEYERGLELARMRAEFDEAQLAQDEANLVTKRRRVAMLQEELELKEKEKELTSKLLHGG